MTDEERAKACARMLVEEEICMCGHDGRLHGYTTLQGNHVDECILRACRCRGFVRLRL